MFTFLSDSKAFTTPHSESPPSRGLFEDLLHNPSLRVPKLSESGPGRRRILVVVDQVSFPLAAALHRPRRLARRSRPRTASARSEDRRGLLGGSGERAGPRRGQADELRRVGEGRGRPEDRPGRSGR